MPEPYDMGVAKRTGNKAVHWRRDPEILARLPKVEEAHLIGYTNVQIAQSLGVVEGTVRNDLKRIAALWQERAGEDIEQQKDRAVAVYRRVQKAAWQEFQAVKDTSLNKSAYLNTVKSAEDSIGKVLGTLAERQEHTGPNGGPIQLQVVEQLVTSRRAHDPTA